MRPQIAQEKSGIPPGGAVPDLFGRWGVRHENSGEEIDQKWAACTDYLALASSLRMEVAGFPMPRRRKKDGGEVNKGGQCGRGGAGWQGRQSSGCNNGQDERTGFLPLMLQVSQLNLPVDHTDADLRTALLKRLGVKDATFTLKQRAIDARRGHVNFNYTLLVEVADEARVLKALKDDTKVIVAPDETYVEVENGSRRSRRSRRPVIVGTGPCGLFAGLLLARAGLKPILLERGKAAGDRARDGRLWRRGWDFNPESNVQYGEGERWHLF